MHTHKLTRDYLNKAKQHFNNSPYPVSKWILFSIEMLNLGYSLRLYRAKTTKSKYLFVKKDNKQVKVRFSDHLPNKIAEDNSDCDYYVGHSYNKPFVNYQQCIIDINQYFSKKN